MLRRFWSLLFKCRMVANGYSRGQLRAPGMVIPSMRIVTDFSHLLNWYYELYARINGKRNRIVKLLV